MGRIAKNIDKVQPRRTRVLWTKTHDDCLVKLMLEQTSHGNKIGTSFKKHAWVDMVKCFNSEMRLSYNLENLKNRFKVWKREYNIYKSLLKHKGFSWDNLNKVLVAPAEEWEDAIKKFPEAAKLRFKPYPRFKDLEVICKNQPLADHTPSSQNLENDAEEFNTSDGSNDDQGFEVHDLVTVHDCPLPIGCEKQTAPIATAGTSFTAEHEEVEAMKDVATSNARNKHRCPSPASTKPADRAYKRQRNEAIGVMKAIAEAFSQRTALMEEKLAANQFHTLQKCMEALNNIEGMEQTLRMKACLAFEKEFNRHMFLLLRPEERLEWLRIICGDRVL